MISRIALVAPAWMMATVVLAAGIPHFHCRCPDGNVKAFCLGSAFKSSGCCCGGTCCSSDGAASCCACSTSAGSGVQARVSCCEHGDQGVPERVATDSSLNCNGCTRSPAESVVFGVTHSKTTAGEDLSTGPLHVPTEVVFISSSPAGRLPTCWQPYRLPPPTDLSVLFEHFLI